MLPTITDVKAALKLVAYSVIGMLLAVFGIEQIGSERLSERLPELTYVTISLLMTGMWAVWQIQESIGDSSILSRLSRRQRNILGFKRDYTRRRVIGTIALVVIAGCITTFGDSLLDTNSYLLVTGGLFGLMTVLCIQHLIAYLGYSKIRAKLQEKIADIERKERNAQKMTPKE